MDTLLRMVWVLAIGLVPIAVFVLVSRRQLRAKFSGKVAPFEELRRRPAGETLRIKLAEFDDRIANWVASMVFVPVVIGASAWYVRPATWVTLAPLAVLSIICTAVFGVRLHRMLCERENYRLGFDGERFVGEELSRLIAHGYEVYHDVPFDGFNIDHVLVGPPGVFSVETKTRRKPVSDSGTKEYRVEFDGSCLRWPWGTDTYGLEQAANNAQTLSQWLSSAVGDPVNVTAILTLPGWLVDRKAHAKNVHVLNPKEIIKLCKGEERLSENLIKRIRHQLDQKCKIEVE